MREGGTAASRARRLRKLFECAASPNAHEAASARAEAMRLVERHGIDLLRQAADFPRWQNLDRRAGYEREVLARVLCEAFHVAVGVSTALGIGIYGSLDALTRVQRAYHAACAEIDRWRPEWAARCRHIPGYWRCEHDWEVGYWRGFVNGAAARFYNLARPALPSPPAEALVAAPARAVASGGGVSPASPLGDPVEAGMSSEPGPDGQESEAHRTEPLPLPLPSGVAEEAYAAGFEAGSRYMIPRRPMPRSPELRPERLLPPWRGVRVQVDPDPRENRYARRGV